MPELNGLVDDIDDIHKIQLPMTGLQEWCSSHESETKYKSIETDIWDLGNGTESMDLLILATIDDEIVSWRMFALCPY